jgi:hypothetical protein
MVASTLVFEARASEGAEQIELVQRNSSPPPLGRNARQTIPFEQWVLSAPAPSRPAVARLVQAWEDGEKSPDGVPLVEPNDDGIRVNAALVAQLPEPEALSLGLPPATRLSLNLQSKGVPQLPDFEVATRWTRPNGLPAQARLIESRIHSEGRDWRIPEPIWSTFTLAHRLNAATDPAERQALLAELRSAIGDEDRTHVRPDGFIERLRLSYAAGFSLDLKPDAAGFDFDPVLFSPERLRQAEDGEVVDEAADGLLPPSQQAAFARRFRQGDGSRRAYLLDDGAILFLDPHLQKVLSVVRRAQAAGPDARRDFVRNPQRQIAEAMGEDGLADAGSVFIETQQFSERVSGIDIWRKPVLPWIKPKPNSWLPESFGLRIGEPPDSAMVEIPIERIDEALAAACAAIKEERPSFTFDNNEIPATEQVRGALSDLAELAHAAAAPEAGSAAAPPASLNRYFLQVRDNLEDVAYAPLVAKSAAIKGPPPALPATLLSQPKPHQIDGFQWLVGCWRRGMPGALLADDMGLGKTYQALAFLAWLRKEQRTPKAVLIVAPTGLLANWRAEIDRHLERDALGPVVSVYGESLRRFREGSARDTESGRAAIDADNWEHAGVVLTTFETMRDYHLSFARHPFAAIIFDEVQKLKNPASQITRAAKTLNAKFQLAMTGTPVENRLQDLWSIFDVIHPGLLGSSKAFEGAYPASDRDKMRELHDFLTKHEGTRPPLLLRRMKDDCLPGLPAKHLRPLPTQMPPHQATAYSKVIQRAFAARGTGRRGYMLEILHMLRGVSLHPDAPEDAGEGYFGASARLNSAFEILDQISSAGEKALIFCESLAMQALLALEIRRRYRLGHEVSRIHGGVAGDQRQAAVDVFQGRPPGFDVMILSPKAGGVGLTLTAANHVIHLSRWWNPAVEDQATDRAFRIGQTRDVFVYLPQAVHPDPAIGPTSFDLKLDALMRRKRELSRGLLLPAEDESDIDSLFESVLAGDEPHDDVHATTAAAPADSTLVEPEPLPTEPAEPPRKTLSPKPATVSPEPLKPRWPSRIAYVPGGTRDFAIFRAPVDGERIVELAIRDPYGCAGSRNRQAIVDLVAILNQSAASIVDAVIICFDAESTDRDYRESDALQQADLEQRWRQAFPSEPGLRHILLSRRQSRNFHDRTIRAKTASGRSILWDISNGIDGVMVPNKECTVHLTVE